MYKNFINRKFIILNFEKYINKKLRGYLKSIKVSNNDYKRIIAKLS